METLLVKIFATALALSQVATTPDAVKTQFDRAGEPGGAPPPSARGRHPQRDHSRSPSSQAAHPTKAFDIEDINLDDLIATAMEDPQALTGEIKAFRGINFADLHDRLSAVLQEREGPEARRSISAR